jgi:hypothetical protein
VLNNAKVTITNAYFHVRGEDDEYQRWLVWWIVERRKYTL